MLSETALRDTLAAFERDFDRRADDLKRQAPLVRSMRIELEGLVAATSQIGRDMVDASKRQVAISRC
jgi:hypothetical protein